jgi:hypothetical protein
MYPGSPLDTPDDDDREVEAALDTAAEEAEREQAEADRLREKALDDFRDSGPGSLGAREDDPEASVCGRPTNGPLVNVTLGRRETFGEFVARIGHSVSVCGTCKRKAGP